MGSQAGRRAKFWAILAWDLGLVAATDRRGSLREPNLSQTAWALYVPPRNPMDPQSSQRKGCAWTQKSLARMTTTTNMTTEAVITRQQQSHAARCPAWGLGWHIPLWQRFVHRAQHGQVLVLQSPRLRACNPSRAQSMHCRWERRRSRSRRRKGCEPRRLVPRKALTKVLPGAPRPRSLRAQSSRLPKINAWATRLPLLDKPAAVAAAADRAVPHPRSNGHAQ